jgi:hypothetical protein
MSFFRIHSPFELNYNLNGNELPNVSNTIKDLGITFDRGLNFHSYIEIACYKALKTLGFIKRFAREFNLIVPLKALYYAFDRSILEYAVVV